MRSNEDSGVSVSSDSALDKAVVLAKTAVAKYHAQRDAEVKAAINAMQQHLDNAEKSMSEKKTGPVIVTTNTDVKEWWSFFPSQALC